MAYELMFKNIAELQSDLSAVVGYLPFVWTLLVKFFIPPVILILFGLSCDAENAAGQKVFGHYEGYVFSPYQILGILIVVFTGFLFLSSLVAPKMYSALQRPEVENKTSVHAAPEDVDKKAEPVESADDAGVDIEQDVGVPGEGTFGETTVNEATVTAIEA